MGVRRSRSKPRAIGVATGAPHLRGRVAPAGNSASPASSLFAMRDHRSARSTGADLGGERPSKTSKAAGCFGFARLVHGVSRSCRRFAHRAFRCRRTRGSRTRVESSSRARSSRSNRSRKGSRPSVPSGDREGRRVRTVVRVAMKRLLAQIGRTAGCEVSPPSGLLILRDGDRLPEDRTALRSLRRRTPGTSWRAVGARWPSASTAAPTPSDQAVATIVSGIATLSRDRVASSRSRSRSSCGGCSRRAAGPGTGSPMTAPATEMHRTPDLVFGDLLPAGFFQR